ncbi:TlpA family protein disulfide reductase [Ferrimonas lipolytica]|uniref:TlpA family protein disulfide reductase n=1 Tax=Ferrimonas lipolytica TaxID=2724191 RepID=A0A6H1UFZ8_9GAMM|nr:TlpA disulfide reductase family protein [Ferrimonas lipolytica]QIZ76722.1 TlpA family protein disulfide reductase [Ferrimonas lipolytica]
MLKRTLVALSFMLFAGAINAKPAPDFPLTLEQPTTLHALSKQGYVYVDFWASWCGPCRYSFPFMNRLKAELGDKGLTVIAVNVDVDPADAKPFLVEHPADFTIHYDPDGDIATAFAVRGMPSSYLIHNGEIVMTHVGFRTSKQQQMFDEIAAHLAD